MEGYTSSTPDTPLQIAETEVLDLIDGGFPASSLNLRFLSHTTLVDRVRKGNNEWWELLRGSDKIALQNVESNVDSYLDELQRRKQAEASRGKVGAFLSRLLKFNQ